MSKKKPGKKPATKAAVKKKAPTKKKSTAAARRPTATRAFAAASNRVASVTIFLYKTDGGFRVRTSPQLLTAAPGFVEWTVVNLASDEPVDVEIAWPAGGPWGDAPIQIRNGNARKSLAGAKAGRYKYNITANGYTEDPEIEYPMN